MAYEPKFQILNPRPIAMNILTWIEVKQVEAFTFFNITAKPIKQFSASVANRAKPVYPSIAVSGDDDAGEYGGDVLLGAYTVTFELCAESPVPATAISTAKDYERTVKSLIANISQEDLSRRTGATEIVLQQIETGFEPMRTNAQQNNFLQICQIRASFTLTAGAYI